MFNFPLHLEFGLKFRTIGVLRKKNLEKTQIDRVFHEKQETFQPALLDCKSSEPSKSSDRVLT